MPNYVYHKMTVTGEIEDISRFEEEMFSTNNRGDVVFDFEKIVPMPDNIFRGNLGQEERKIHGANNWHDWSCQNWGTKWNACHTAIDDISTEDCFVFRFDTAWSTPSPILEKLVKKYPNLDFEVHCIEEGGFFFYHWNSKEGDLTDEYFMEPDFPEAPSSDYASIYDAIHGEGAYLAMLEECEILEEAMEKEGSRIILDNEDSNEGKSGNGIDMSEFKIRST